MAGKTLASAWVSVGPTGFADFGRAARDGIKRVMRGFQATVPVEADTKPATTDLDKLKAKLKDFSRTVATARAGVDTKQGAADLARLDVSLDRLNRKVSSPRITLEGIKAAEAELLGFEASFDRLNDKTARPSIAARTGGVLAGAGAALGPVAGGAGVLALGSGALAIASPLAAAATAAAAFGAVAIPELTKVHTATTANAKAQATYNASVQSAQATYAKQMAAAEAALAQAKTAQQRQAALNKEHAAAAQLSVAEAKALDVKNKSTTRLTGSEQQLQGQIQTLGKMWSQLETSLAPVVVSVAALAVTIARDFLPVLGPLVTAGAKVLTAFLQPLGQWINSVNFDVIIGAFDQFGVQVAKLAGPQLVALLASLLQLFVKIMPAGVTILGVLLPLLVTMVQDLTPVITALANVTAATLAWLDKNHLLIPAIAALGAALLVAIVAIDGASAPLWLVVAALAAVVVGIVELVKHWGTIWGEIQKIAGDAWKWLWANVFAPMNTFFTSTIPAMVDIAKEQIRVWWDDIEILFLKGEDAIVGIMARLPGPLGAPFKAAHRSISSELAGIQNDVRIAQGNIQADWDKIHGKTLTLQLIASGQGGVKVFSQGLAAKEILLSKLAAGGYIRMGSGPASDDVPAMLSRGELVVPAGMVAAGVVDHLRGRLPGFASGGLAGFSTLGRQAAAMPDAAGAALAQDGEAALASTGQAVINAMVAALRKAIAAAAALSASGFGSLGNLSPNLGAVAALELAASKYGWNKGAEWQALNYVEMREAGYNIHAQNPSSGAYGMAQFINGPSEYYTYGGNPSTAYGQSVAMVNYIRQRYGDAIAAANHERAFNWYSRGGLVPGMAAGGTVPDASVWKASFMADQAQEYRAWANLYGLSRKLPSARSALHALAAAQSIEEAGYDRVLGGGNTPGNLALLAGRLRKVIAAAQVGTLAHGAHPAWDKGVQQWAGALLAMATGANPPQFTGSPGKLTGGPNAPWDPGSLGPVMSAPGGVLTFDRGGLWPSGTLGWNGSGKTETVLPGGSGGEVHVHLHMDNHGVIGSQAEVRGWLTREMNYLARTGYLDQAVKRASGR